MKRRKEDAPTSERILKELAAIGFARVTDYMRFEGDKLVLKPASELTDEKAAAVLSVENGTGGVKMKFYDKMKALELLGKAMGLFDGTAARGQPENNLLEAILKATKEEVSADGIQELQQAPGICGHMVESAGVEGP